MQELIPSAIKARLTNPSALDVKVVQVTASTQLLAKKYLAGHQLERPVVFLANQQTAGYGQHGRHFYSPASTGLYLSLLLPPQSITRLRQGGLLTTACAVVLIRVLERYCPSCHLAVKWVNDVYNGRKKIAGILTEVNYHPNHQTASLIIGIGVNLTTKSFPQDIQQPVGALTNCRQVNRNYLAGDLLNELLKLVKAYPSGQYLPEYRSRCFLLGKWVEIQTSNGVITGIATEIDANGALLVKTSGGNRVVYSGEVQKVNYK